MDEAAFCEDLRAICVAHGVAIGSDEELWISDHDWSDDDKVASHERNLNFLLKFRKVEPTAEELAAAKAGEERRAREYAEREAEIEAERRADPEWRAIMDHVEVNGSTHVVGFKARRGDPAKWPELPAKINGRKLFQWIIDSWADKPEHAAEPVPVRSITRFVGLETANGWAFSSDLADAVNAGTTQ